MKVISLFRYPLKSAQGERLESSSVTHLGLAGDHQWAVIDALTGFPLTARREPRLLELAASVVDGALAVSAAETRLPDDAALSEWLGRPVHLALPPSEDQPSYEFPIDPENEAGDWSTWRGPAQVWQDSTRSRISILSRATIGARDVRRFRPNILIDESDEDQLVGRLIQIGSVQANVMKRLDRCVVVTRPQPGGLAKDVETLRWIHREHEGFLGVGCLIANSGVVTVGDNLIDLGPSHLPPERFY